MAITAGGSLNSVPAPFKQTLATNYLDLNGAAGWGQQYVPDLMEKEAEVFGPRTISGFLSQVGAEESMTADQVIWSEQGRLHLSYNATVATGGGAVIGAYAAYKFLSATDLKARAHYDWMGYTANFIAILAFLPLPFAGYWLMAEIYAYSQQMGITAMGGILAWLFIVQAVLIGTILLAGNYYLWSGMSRTKGSERYTWMIKYIAMVLVTCFLIWVTPHTLILSASEMKLLGGSHHHLLGPLGIMPAKNIAVNLMLIFTFLSFQLYRRSDKEITVGWAGFGNALMVSIYVVAIVNVIFAGVYYGYFTNTVYKVGSSVAQVVSTLVVIIAGVVIDTYMFKGAKKLPSEWGKVSNRAQYALFALPVAFTWLMALMGYVRSSVRTNWHVYTVMKDNSPDNYIPAIGFAGNMMTIVTVLFLIFVLFIFWVASLSDTKQPKPDFLTGDK